MSGVPGSSALDHSRRPPQPDRRTKRPPPKESPTEAAKVFRTPGRASKGLPCFLIGKDHRHGTPKTPGVLFQLFKIPLSPVQLLIYILNAAPKPGGKIRHGNTLSPCYYLYLFSY